MNVADSSKNKELSSRLNGGGDGSNSAAASADEEKTQNHETRGSLGGHYIWRRRKWRNEEAEAEGEGEAEAEEDYDSCGNATEEEDIYTLNNNKWISKPYDDFEGISRTQYWNMIYILLHTFQVDFIILFILKLVRIALSFTGPYLVQTILLWLQNDDKTSQDGILIVFFLFLSFVGKTFAGIQTEIVSAKLAIKIKAGLTQIVFQRALSLPLYVLQTMEINPGFVTNLAQVDISRVAHQVHSMNELWGLPLQIGLVLFYLYTQVHSAFFYAIYAVAIMIPVNFVIMKIISYYSKELMFAKDERIKMILDFLGNMKSVKLMGLEIHILSELKDKRTRELYFLRIIKLLDAINVCLWATMRVILPFITLTAAIMIQERDPSDKILTMPTIFTTLSLLAMLIHPMNAYPWVIHGLIEARISLIRMVRLLLIDKNGNFCFIMTQNRRQRRRQRRRQKNKEKMKMKMKKDTKEMENKILFWGNRYTWPILKSGGELRDKVLVNRRTSKLTHSDSYYYANEDENLCMFSFESQLHFNILKLVRGHLVGVVGRVACGKSMFLLSLINETLALSDFGDTKKRKIAYCSQQPFIHTGTIRSNILMGDVYNKKKYTEIVEGCCLLPDFNVFPECDLANVGQGGNMLSGGQRLRIGVARALYMNFPIVLLDDPYSALDAYTSTQLHQFLLSYSKRYSIALIVATHSVHLLRDAAQIIHIQKHVVKDIQEGNLQHNGIEILQNGDDAFQKLISSEVKNEISDFVKDLKEGAKLEKNTKDLEIDFDEDEEDSGESEIESYKRGKIEPRLYSKYLNAMQKPYLYVTIIAMIFMQCSGEGISLYYAYWAQNKSTIDDHDFFLITSILLSINLVSAIVRSFVYALAGLNACTTIYDTLTASTINTFMSFFDVTPLGIIINRFGKDTNVIDEQLPGIFNQVLAQFFLVIGSTFIISFSVPPMLLLVFLIIGLYYYIRTKYMPLARNLRRLGSVYRSPLFSSISDSLSNGPTIRSSNKNALYTKKTSKQIDDMNRIHLNTMFASCWFSLRLELLGSLLACSIAIYAVANAHYGAPPPSSHPQHGDDDHHNNYNDDHHQPPHFGDEYELGAPAKHGNYNQKHQTLLDGHFSLQMGPGFIALALLNSFSLVEKIHNLITAWTHLEQDMVSVERIIEFSELPNEFDTSEKKVVDFSKKTEIDSTINELHQRLVENASVLDNDDEVGELNDYECLKPSISVQLTNVYLRYHESPNYALNGLTLPIIPAGSRVAIVGRTGSGKSTLIRLLSRVNDYEDGSVLLNGIDIKRIPKRTLRKSITVIPQDPLLFSGALRKSVDPYEEYTDSELFIALKRSGFLDTLRSSKESEESEKSEEARGKVSEGSVLQMQLSDSGSNLSCGQKQLLCLSRTLLNGTKLILVDEAASNIDFMTEQLLYKVLKECADEWKATLMIISHNVKGLRNYVDYVIEMTQGVSIRGLVPYEAHENPNPNLERSEGS